MAVVRDPGAGAASTGGVARHRPGHRPGLRRAGRPGGRALGRLAGARRAGAAPSCPATGTCSCRPTWPTPRRCGAMVDRAPRAARRARRAGQQRRACSPRTRRWTTSYADWQAGLVADAGGQPGGRRRTRRSARVPHLVAAGGGAVVNVSSRGRLPRRAEQPGLRRVEGRAERVRASRWRSRWRRTASRSAAWRRGSCRPRWPARCSTARAATPSGRSRPSAGWPAPRRSPRRCCGSPRPRRAFSTGTIVDVNGASYLRS